ncbi:unnamed protein product [Cuscuta epithymum]|uniref:Protein kinase domain-containing protein n=1 Tax=Cuscuta epithymum TaxID=186058 RepID=A0AAV0EBI1_9ASTE|nr:unnamed protein product [Cuscuta epithymum]
MVKIWKPRRPFCTVHHGDNESRFRDEMALLQHPNLMSHPNMVKLMGYIAMRKRKLGLSMILNHMTQYIILCLKMTSLVGL